MSLIKGYPKGSDLTIMNTMYRYPRKQDDGKYSNGSMTIIYRDNVTGKKGFEYIDNSSYTYYMLKPENYKSYNQFYVDKSLCEEITVPYKDLEKDLATRLKELDFYYNNLKMRNKSANKVLHTRPSVFGTDIHINNFYRKKFAEEYTNSVGFKLTKAYLDIEVDGINAIDEFPQLGECPINAVAVFNEVNDTLYSFILRTPDNPLMVDFERYVQEHDFEIEFKDFLYNNVGGWKNAYRMGLKTFNLITIFFDKEIDLIANIFRVINITQPDFVLAWNMAFDIPYIIARISALGYDPTSIICPPEFPVKSCFYKVDTFHDDAGHKGDYADISSYSVYLDQMIQFASRRKNESAYPTFKLDFIGGEVAGAHKLDYRHITENIAEFPYKDFRLFIMYNLNDVVVQKCIESKTGDIDYVFNKAIVNNTMYPKIHRNTIYLANRVGKFIADHFNGIIGNNENKSKLYNKELEDEDLSDAERKKKDEEDKFKGAFVADMTKISEVPKVLINGTAIMLAYNLNDFDFKRLYPSITQQYNIAPYTQIGKLSIPEKVWENENPHGYSGKDFERATVFLENLVSGDYLSFCHRWFNLPSFMEMIEFIKVYFNEHQSTRSLQWRFSQERKLEVMREFKSNFKIPVLNEVQSQDKIRVWTPYEKMPTEVKNEMDFIIKEVWDRAIL